MVNMIQPVDGFSAMTGSVVSGQSADHPDAEGDVTSLSRSSRGLNGAVGARPEPAEGLLDLLQGTRSGNVIDSVDRILNLGSGGNLLGDLGDLSRQELAEAFEILSNLFERGIVGYEYRKINGQPHKVFIDVAIGSDAHRAPLYRSGRLDGYL